MRSLLYLLICLQAIPASVKANQHTQKQVALVSQLQHPASAEQALRLMNCVFSTRGIVLEIIDNAPSTGPYLIAEDSSGEFELYWKSGSEATPKPLVLTSSTSEEICQLAIREIAAFEKIAVNPAIDLRPSLAGSALTNAPLELRSADGDKKSFFARLWPLMIASGLVLGAASFLIINRSKQENSSPEIIFVD